MKAIKELKERLLDYRDIKLAKIIDYFTEIIEIRKEKINNQTEMGRAINGFKKIKEEVNKGIEINIDKVVYQEGLKSNPQNYSTETLFNNK